MQENHTSWNKGRAQGQKRALIVAPVRRVKEMSYEPSPYRGLPLTTISIHNLLCASHLTIGSTKSFEVTRRVLGYTSLAEASAYISTGDHQPLQNARKLQL